MSSQPPFNPEDPLANDELTRIIAELLSGGRKLSQVEEGTVHPSDPNRDLRTEISPEPPPRDILAEAMTRGNPPIPWSAGYTGAPALGLSNQQQADIDNALGIAGTAAQGFTAVGRSRGPKQTPPGGRTPAEIEMARRREERSANAEAWNKQAKKNKAEITAPAEWKYEVVTKQEGKGADPSETQTHLARNLDDANRIGREMRRLGSKGSSYFIRPYIGEKGSPATSAPSPASKSVWEVFNPSNGKTVRKFNHAAEAHAYAIANGLDWELKKPLDVQRDAAKPNTDYKYAWTGVRKMAETMVKQYQDILRDEKPGTSTFKTKGVRTEQLGARVVKDRPAGENMAEFSNTGSTSNYLKYYPDEFKELIKQIGRLAINPESIARSSKTPIEFAWNLISTLSHELGMHSQKSGGSHTDVQAWSTPERYKMRSISDVPKSLKVKHPQELLNQFGLDAARARMMETPLAKALLQTANDPSSPIAVSWQQLRAIKD